VEELSGGMSGRLRRTGIIALERVREGRTRVDARVALLPYGVDEALVPREPVPAGARERDDGVRWCKGARRRAACRRRDTSARISTT
jgi:hypothetical protein